MTLQDRIWANRIQNLPEINETHMLGKRVTIGQQVGTVTKEAGDNATGEVYEVELEDGTTVTAGAHEMIITDLAAGTGEPTTDIQAEGTGSGDGCGESVEKIPPGPGQCKGDDCPEEEDEEFEFPADEEGTVEEGKDEEYEKFFKAALKKFGVDSPADFKSDDEKKKFFDYVDKNWKGEKNESVEFSVEEVAHFDSILKKKIDEVYYRSGERIKYLHKQWNYAMKQIENSVKVMEKEYSRPSPDWAKIHQEMYNITNYQLQNIQDFIPQKGYKGPLEGSPVDIIDSVQHELPETE